MTTVRASRKAALKETSFEATAKHGQRFSSRDKKNFPVYCQ